MEGTVGSELYFLNCIGSAMLPYLSILLASFSLSCTDGTKWQKLFILPFFTFLIVFVAFRVGGTGPKDYDAYLRLYNKLSTYENVIDPTVHAEIGFRYVSFLGNYIGFNEQFIIVAMAILSILPVAYIIYTRSHYKFLSIVIWMPYLLTMNMHSSRISVAAAFCFLTIIFLAKGRNYFALIASLVAISFHSSALALLALVFTRFDLGKLCIACFISFLLATFINPFGVLASFLSILGAEHLSWMINSYISSSDYGYPMPVYDPRIVLNFGVVLLIFNIRRSIVDDLMVFLLKVNVIGVTLMLAFSSVTIISWRVSYLFLIVTVLTIPAVSYYYNVRFYSSFGIKRIMSITFSFLFFLYVLSLIFISLPYKFYF